MVNLFVLIFLEILLRYEKGNEPLCVELNKCLQKFDDEVSNYTLKNILYLFYYMKKNY